mgnify:CR=1 FL=1
MWLKLYSRLISKSHHYLLRISDRILFTLLKTMNYQSETSIAYVISPHGFGHAARASAVMEAIRGRIPNINFEIFTLVPEWFFHQSLESGYSYYPCWTDIGVVQSDPFHENPQATADQLDSFLPFKREILIPLIDTIKRKSCRLVISDIAPLGIAAAGILKTPSVLIENFTWDWIYQSYSGVFPGLNPHIKYFEEFYNNATVHIQTTPVCDPKFVNLTTNPVARSPHASRDLTRELLGLKKEDKVVLITMGGIEQKYQSIGQLGFSAAIKFVIPGGASTYQVEKNVILLPHHSNIYHPDLVYASDLVVGKLGYSTVAEAFYAGIPYLFVPRDNFPETEPLGKFVHEQLNGEEISLRDFETGNWIEKLPRIFDMKSIERNELNGAFQIAAYLEPYLKA